MEPVVAGSGGPDDTGDVNRMACGPPQNGYHGQTR